MNQHLTHMVPSGIRRFTAMAQATPGCKMLTIGEPDFATPQAICDAATQALAQGLTHYAPNRGTDSLRDAIAQYETARGMTCRRENVLVTIGATGALNTAISCLLNPGDEIIIPTPAFSLYESIALSLGAKPVFLDLSKTDFQITPEALARCITPKTRAIVLNSPNNPTGVTLNRASLRHVRNAILGKEIFLLCDQVYAPLCSLPPEDLTLDPELRHQTILCQSFSKPWAMTGWRIGYLVAPQEIVEQGVLLQAAQIASVPTFVQAGAERALTVSPAPMAARYATRRSYVTQRLQDMGLSFPTPQGAFYVFPDISPFGMDSEEFCTQLIRQAGVACVPGSCFRGEGHIRLSYCCSEETLAQGLDRLEGFLASISTSTH